MKKTYFVTTVIFLLISLTYCKKPNEDNSNKKVFAGISESITHVVLDTVCGFYEVHSNIDEESFEIDLDSDGIADIKLHGRQSYWHGPTDYFTKISCLHDNIFIAVEQHTDTVFYRKSIIINQSNKIEHKTYHYYSCLRQSDNDSVHSFRNEIIAYTAEYGVEISNDLTWQSQSLKLRHYAYPFGLALPGIVNETTDTIFYEGSGHIYNCRNLPQNQEILLCFKLKKAEKEYFAWLKIMLADNYKVYIFDYGINI